MKTDKKPVPVVPVSENVGGVIKVSESRLFFIVSKKIEILTTLNFFSLFSSILFVYLVRKSKEGELSINCSP